MRPTRCPGRMCSRLCATPRLPLGRSACQPGSPPPGGWHPLALGGTRGSRGRPGKRRRRRTPRSGRSGRAEVGRCAPRAYGLTVAAASPSEVVQDPFQRQFGLRVAVRPSPGRQEEPLHAGMPGARLCEVPPYCPMTSICGKKGAKATCSCPRACSMAARADRSRGLLAGRAQEEEVARPPVRDRASGQPAPAGNTRSRTAVRYPRWPAPDARPSLPGR